jgi:hypothetical protein
MEAWRLKMEPWIFCRPVIADSHHFDEELDPDLHLSEKVYLHPHKVMRIRNPGTNTLSRVHTGTRNLKLEPISTLVS